MTETFRERFLESIKKNNIGILLILISAFTLAVGQLIWKLYGLDHLLFVFIGFLLYGIGAIFMLLSYRHGSFSVIHPMMSTSYILAFLFGWLFLDEKVTLIMVFGLCLILIGNILIGGGDH